MNKTEKFHFLSPGGENYYDIEHQNQNWRDLEKILISTGTPDANTIIERLESGGIKITYADKSYTIYGAMADDGSINVKEYDESGALLKEYTVAAWYSIPGTNIRIDWVLDLMESKNTAIWTTLGTAGIGIQNVMTTSQYNNQPLRENLAGGTIPNGGMGLNESVNVKVLWADQSYSTFDLLGNGKTRVKNYSMTGEFISEHDLVDQTMNLVYTNVRIAQLEKKFENFCRKYENYGTPIPGGAFTLLNGIYNENCIGCEFKSFSSNNSNDMAAYYTLKDIPVGIYALSFRLVEKYSESVTTGAQITYATVEILDGDTNGEVIATCKINTALESCFVSASSGNTTVSRQSAQGVFGFAFKVKNPQDSKRRITVRVSTASNVAFDYMILNHAQPSFGASYAY